MKPTLVKMAALFLVAVLVIVGLTGCDRSARERESEPTEPAAEAQATQSGAGSETAAPGETVVSAVTPPSTGSGTVVAVTQPPAGETSEPAEQATAVPSEEAQPSPEPESGGATEQQAGAAILHTVQQGETLASIARRYGTSWQAIAQANDLVNPDQIYVGQKLKIPSGSTGGSSSGATGCRIRHTVKNGEWVWQIARNYGVSPYDILAANGLTIQSGNNIQPGTVLCIP